MSGFVNRYDLTYSEHFGPGIGVKPNGKYVEFTELEKVQQRIAELEAELARLDAAAGEPVAHIIQDESCFPGMVGHIHVDFTPTCRDVKNNGTVQPLYAAAKPSALPPEIVTDALAGTANYERSIGYNKAIADAKALGCKAIKLPDYVDDLHGVGPVLSLEKVIDSLLAQGFSVEVE